MMEKHASIESVMMLEEFNSVIFSDNDHNCSLNDNFNASLTSLTTDSGVTENFQDAESTLQASDNIQPGANSTTSGSDGTLLPASVTGLTREATETTAGDQHAPKQRMAQCQWQQQLNQPSKQWTALRQWQLQQQNQPLKQWTALCQWRLQQLNQPPKQRTAQCQWRLQQLNQPSKQRTAQCQW